MKDPFWKGVFSIFILWPPEPPPPSKRYWWSEIKNAEQSLAEDWKKVERDFNNAVKGTKK